MPDLGNLNLNFQGTYYHGIHANNIHAGNTWKIGEEVEEVDTILSYLRESIPTPRARPNNQGFTFVDQLACDLEKNQYGNIKIDVPKFKRKIYSCLL
ncbi:hypothetical protein FRX31_031448 [Thalictrum thalictroides]|uniref:Uncharacterized protein n=1 Tax=Thalictrum thalictroides TaxID=46969 RepID=A0A7J6V485_THATH|nr:hypothetical protein FRX31_031448 [Thalictrum thalictroides]